MAPPSLTFFCELTGRELGQLFTGSEVVEDLQGLGASVSMGIRDLGAERAEVVRRLNAAGVPVIAWQLLPEEEGYWFNLDNAPQAAEGYRRFRAWTLAQGLSWAGIGIDIEPDIREVGRLATNWWRLIQWLVQGLFNGDRLRRAQAAYRSLVAQIHSDGYTVDGYHFPFLVDERRVGSTFLQRLAGLVDPPVDREVLMLYSSFLRPHGPGVLWSYGPEAQSIGIGSTGGGVDVGGLGDVPPLDWAEFSRDLILARRWTSDLHIFSLEGCVEQGFLTRLRGFDWEQPIIFPYRSTKQVEGLRRLLRAFLWVSARPIIPLLGVMGATWLVSYARRTRHG